MSRDGRFAPSPSGPLHLGSLRTALVAWLFARSQGARFLVRIEDLDPQRSRREFERSQLADLAALGIDSDRPPVRQSERWALYEEALHALQESGRLYPCFCTRAEIREAASAPHGSGPPAPTAAGVVVASDPGLAPGAYPGTCRELSERERSRRIREGRQFALRIRADSELIEFDDRLLGGLRGRVDDFVVRRADGVPAYQLAVVVDDAAQAIGEVVRGADLADSTPRQILLARVLRTAVPSYAHVPLVLGPDGARLAKRHGTVSLADRREPPEATLAVLAHSLGLALDSPLVGSPRDLLDGFDPARIPRAPVVIDDPTPW